MLMTPEQIRALLKTLIRRGVISKTALEIVQAHLDPASADATFPLSPALFGLGGGTEPDGEIISGADVDRAVKRWDQVMPEYKGMLEAEVI